MLELACQIIIVLKRPLTHYWTSPSTMLSMYILLVAGYFMKVEIGARTRVGQIGRLSTPAYPRPISGYRCAEFWYMISGTTFEFSKIKKDRWIEGTQKPHAKLFLVQC